MDKRLIAFMLISLAILQGYFLLLSWWQGPPPEQPAAVAEAEADKKPADAQAPPAEQPAQNAEGTASQPVTEGESAPPPASEPAAAPPPPEVRPVEAEQWVTLGSVDPDEGYRLLVTLTNRGAALARAELSSPQFRDLEDRSGYLGHLLPEGDINGRGCRVRVVGRGTPAALAGIQPGDLITEIAGSEIDGRIRFEEALARTRPDDTIEIKLLRHDEPLTVTATLMRRPLEVIRPEGADPLSMLATLAIFDRDKLREEETEFSGVDLLHATWQVKSADESHVSFSHVTKGLEFIKTYRLAKAAENLAEGPGYNLTFEIEIKNLDAQAHKVAYRLDGPNGLPDEGWWYATKIGRDWGGAGMRDIVVTLWQNGRLYPSMVTCRSIAKGDLGSPWRDQPFGFLAVDAQYFSTALFPLQPEPGTVWCETAQPIRVGPVPEDKAQWNRTNTSFRLQSPTHELAPQGSMKQAFTLFAGPKQRVVLESYDVGNGYTLSDLVYFGWFGWVSRPMLRILYFFHDYVTFGNYGLAIVLLTVLVRSCMFPLSRKQAVSAQKMQLLQPELKKIQEKYKNNTEAKTKATQELFAKHNYNPLGGCLLVFIQLPIFVGLYRSLAVNVELRQAPLISENIRWASNLAAPDMLFRWSEFMPQFVIGWLGPYFNLLPVITIALFLWQQKMFMPPATDDQTRMQMKMMQYMMVFMGVMFFKVPSGLCIYFIASSLWGIAERKLLPKTMKPAAAPVAAETKSDHAAGSNGSGGSGGTRRSKQRGSR
ncbi:MAG: YidC/Oxa1 family insertase periplasmic-domain containing protein [Pirellulales bacterium]|nr:YidC/Oxa1 family insertase periplasmic-domain containing protein [Pirellulales bacterium]